MSRIPFTLEAWLKDKNQRVETRDGRIVHDIWPVKNKTTIKAYQTEVCALIDGEEDALVFFAGGKYLPVNAESPFDLFLVTPEEEMTEFESSLRQVLSEALSGEMPTGSSGSMSWAVIINDDEIKKLAPRILSIAKKELQPEIDAEIEKAYKTQDDVVFHKGWEQGKADALKDLPRWRKCGNGACGGGKYPIALVESSPGHYFLADCLGITGEKYIMLSDLEKLSGFKED